MAFFGSRNAFGHPISKDQHNAFKVGKMATEIKNAEDFSYLLIAHLLGKKDLPKQVSMAKGKKA